MPNEIMKRSCMTIAWSRARRFVSSGRRSRRALSSFRRFRRSTMSSTTLQESSMTPRDNEEDVLRPTFSAPPQSFPRIDYVLVYDHRDVAHDARRNIFHQRIRRLGLQIDIEQVGNHSFVKIFCPFDRLCYEAEKMGLEMPLKGCEIRELESSGFLAWIWKYFVTDNEVDFVSGPFATDKLYLFEGFENELTLFRSGLRSLLVHNLLMEPLPDTSFSPTAWGDSSPATSLRRLATTQSVRSRANKDFDPEHDYNLPRLLLQGIYKDSFVMHDRSVDDPSYTKLKERDPEQHTALMKRLQKFHDPRRELNETWTKLFKFQPLWKIRNYFGEKIALYCAWMGLLISFLWIPSIAGVAVYGNALYQVIQNHTIQTCKCYASNQTLSDGSRQCGEEKTVSDYIALDIVGVLRRSFIHFGSANALFSFAICVWAALFTEFWKRKNNTLAYRWDCNKWEATEQDRPEFVGTETQLDPIAKEMIPIYPESKRILRYFVSFLVVLLMMLCVIATIGTAIIAKVFFRVEAKCLTGEPAEMSDFVPECDDKNDYEKSPFWCILVGTFFPALFMAWSVMIWERIYLIVVRQLNKWALYAFAENHQTQSDYNDSYILKLFAFQFINHYAVLFYMIAIRPDEYGFQENGILWLGSDYKDTCEKLTCTSAASLQVLLLMVIKPVTKFCHDMAIPWIFQQIRWTLYMMKLSKAASKVADMERKHDRSDSFSSGRNASYLNREWHKPPINDFSLGEFTEKVMQFGYLLMFASAFTLAPVILLVVNFVDLRIDSRRLLWFNRRPIATITADIGMWESIIKFLIFCGIVTNGYLVASRSSFVIELDFGFDDRVLVMLIFENVLLLLIYAIDIVIPDIPSNIKLAIRRENYQVSKILAAGFIPSTHLTTRTSSLADLSPKVDRPPSCNSVIEDDVRRELDVMREASSRNAYINSS